MAHMEKVGYGQVEPNRLTAQKTKEVFAQLPADASIALIENGMAMIYNQVEGKVTLPVADGDAACLVMNEIILEDPHYQSDSDFAMIPFVADKYQTAKAAYPRLYALHVGDTFTTNTCVSGLALKDTIVAGTDGYWKKGTSNKLELAVIAKTTMPDGQEAVKLCVTKVNAVAAGA